MKAQESYKRTFQHSTAKIKQELIQNMTENHYSRNPQIFKAKIKASHQNNSSNKIIQLPVNPDHECECHQPKLRRNQISC